MGRVELDGSAMHNTEREEAFVKAFIVPERRERYRLMLTNPKRRHKFLDSLNHMRDFTPLWVRQIPGGLHTPEGVIRLLNDRNIKNSDAVYSFSDVSELDGQSLPMQQALEQVLGFESGSVVCGLPGQLADYRPEAPENGAILKKPSLHS